MINTPLISGPYRVRQDEVSVQPGLKVGFGECIGHHGEILQGPVAQFEHGRVDALVTLPVQEYSSSAIYEHQPDAEVLTVLPWYCKKAVAAVRLMCVEFGLPEPRGLLRIESNIPVAKGMGSSTSDVVAALKAAARAYDCPLSNDQLAKLAVRSERASDATMFSSLPALFTHRNGELVELFGPRLPSVRIIGLDTASNGMDTLSLAPINYSKSDLHSLDCALALMRHAVKHDSVSALGRAATISSTVNQQYRPKAHFAELLQLAENFGVGIQVSHSGTVAGILFDPADSAISSAMNRVREAISNLGFEITKEMTLGMEFDA